MARRTRSTKDLAKIHQLKSVQRGLERFIKRRHLDKAKLPEPFVMELLRKLLDSGGVVLEPVPMILPHEFQFYLYNERRCDFTDRISGDSNTLRNFSIHAGAAQKWLHDHPAMSTIADRPEFAVPLRLHADEVFSNKNKREGSGS